MCSLRPTELGEAGLSDFWRSTIALDKRSAKSFIRINDRIRAREIRVIDENGEQLGILPPFEALRIARERGLDLVEVSPTAVPPVCRIQDYGRYLYEKEKSERAASLFSGGWELTYALGLAGLGLFLAEITLRQTWLRRLP